MTIWIAKNIVTETVIKKSRFVCQLSRVEDATAAERALAGVRRDEAKASHHCYAYVIGPSQGLQRMSDDGEPAGTAGPPILEVLKRRQLTDVLAVVTRYFGGVKLGAGGLIRAYAGAVSGAVEQAGLVARVTEAALLLTLDYSLYDRLSRFLSEAGVAADRPDFATAVTLRVYVAADRRDSFVRQLTDRFAGRVAAIDNGQRIVEVPLEQTI